MTRRSPYSLSRKRRDPHADRRRDERPLQLNGAHRLRARTAPACRALRCELARRDRRSGSHSRASKHAANRGARTVCVISGRHSCLCAGERVDVYRPRRPSEPPGGGGAARRDAEANCVGADRPWSRAVGYRDKGSESQHMDLRHGSRSAHAAHLRLQQLSPLWSPDRNGLAWSSDARGKLDVFLISADGSGERQQLTPVDGPGALLESWLPDGRFLLYSSRKTDAPIVVLSLGENRTPRVFLGTAANESNPRFSPDGEWVAHNSDVSGRSEVYLRSFRDPDLKYQVSTEGGTDPG